MISKNVKIFSNPLETASEFADYFLEQVSKATTFTVALSGGSTPKLLFNCLAENQSKSDIWKKVEFYWGDERCVPPNNADSNYKMTKEHLLDKIEIPGQNIHRILGENEIVKKTDSIVDVPVKRLDFFIDELNLKRIDFLRMDVEGYEYYIYKGMRNSLKKFKPMIQMEFHCRALGNKKTLELLSMLQEDEYEMVYYIVRELDRPTVMNENDVQKISINQIISLIDKGKTPSTFLTLLRPIY